MGIALILLKGLLQMDSRTPLTVTKQRVLYAEAAKKPQQKLSFFEDFMMGGASASVSKTISAPIERVKMMVQNQGEMLKQGLIDTPYKGVIDCFARTYQTEGLARSGSPTAPTCCVTFPRRRSTLPLRITLRLCLPPRRRRATPFGSP